MQKKISNKPLTSKQLLALKKIAKQRWGTERQRFWRKVIKHTRGCWQWIGGSNEHGYGHFQFRGRLHKAARASWILANGEIPDGLWVLHECDNPPCVKPGHLFLGTQQDNIDDCVKKRRHAYGTNSGKAKLAESQVLEIRKNYKPNARVQVAESKKYGISIITYRHIVYGRGWKHLIPAGG